MKVLVIGGTGLISVGIVKHLLARKAEVHVFNRAQRESTLPGSEICHVGDRQDISKLSGLAQLNFDVVIDMICFSPEQANATIHSFANKCEHLIFCSTVCTYGSKFAKHVLIEEDFPQEPISGYGQGKLECERLFLKAHDDGKFAVTVIRPSHTYGPGSPLIDQLEFNPTSWDRIEKALPVLCAGDGLGLWQSTHRDDVGKLFAYASLNKTTYGECYNATRDSTFCWKDYYRDVATALDCQAQLVFMPTWWIVKQDPQRFELLNSITQYHGAYSSSRAKRDVPKFICEVDLVSGAKDTLRSSKDRGVFLDSSKDLQYQDIINEALAFGAEVKGI